MSSIPASRVMIEAERDRAREIAEAERRQAGGQGAPELSGIGHGDSPASTTHQLFGFSETDTVDILKSRRIFAEVVK